MCISDCVCARAGAVSDALQECESAFGSVREYRGRTHEPHEEPQRTQREGKAELGGESQIHTLTHSLSLTHLLTRSLT